METPKDGQLATLRCEDCGETMNESAKQCKNCGWLVPATKPVRGLAATRMDTTGAFEEPDLAPAGLLVRIAGGFVDWTIAVVLTFGIYLALGIGLTLISTGNASGVGPEHLMLIAMGMSLLLVPWLYFAVLESSALQGPIGKALLGLRVTDVEGNSISFARASARYLTRIGTLLTGGAGLIPIAFTKRRQSLHDLLAGTLVQR